MTTEENKKYYLYELKMFDLNIVSLIIFAVIIFLTTLLVESNVISINEEPFSMIFILYIPYLFLHEILHALSYTIHGANLKNITFGIHLEKGVLCCLCKQNISRKNILISLIYPFFFIGIVTYIIGLIFNDIILIVLSILNIVGCSGDLVMFFDFLKLKDFEYSEYDNPTAFGLYSSKDLSNKKMFGLRYIETKDSLEIKNLKKLQYSKLSIIVIILLFILGIILLFV